MTTPELACTCHRDPGERRGVGRGHRTRESDSSICRAAVHAGAVPAAGGAVKVKKASGCPKYTGSDANGIHTDSWGDHANSFYFDSLGGSDRCAS